MPSRISCVRLSAWCRQQYLELICGSTICAWRAPRAVHVTVEAARAAFDNVLFLQKGNTLLPPAVTSRQRRRHGRSWDKAHGPAQLVRAKVIDADTTQCPPHSRGKPQLIEFISPDQIFNKAAERRHPESRNRHFTHARGNQPAHSRRWWSTPRCH